MEKEKKKNLFRGVFLDAAVAAASLHDLFYGSPFVLVLLPLTMPVLLPLLPPPPPAKLLNRLCPFY